MHSFHLSKYKPRVLKFDPENPFPLLPENCCSYPEEQEHSSLVDAWLGLQTQAIEDSVRRRVGNAPTGDVQHWIGLPVKTLLTPYTEIRRMLHELALPPGSTLVDLGAAYGRIAFVLARHAPEVAFLGYECVPERVEEARRCLKDIQGARAASTMIEEADLSCPDFQPAEADCYFLYDFGSREAIAKTLGDLQAVARKRPIVVVGRGRASRDAIERTQPWLSAVVPPVHFPHFSIYRSAAQSGACADFALLLRP